MGCAIGSIGVSSSELIVKKMALMALAKGAAPSLEDHAAIAICGCVPLEHFPIY